MEFFKGLIIAVGITAAGFLGVYAAIEYLAAHWQ